MKSAFCAVLCLFAMLGSSPGQDLRYPPSPADKQALIAEGWEKAADRLAASLAQYYQPGLAGRPGSTGMTAYRQWLHLWKWAALLSSQETSEFARLAQNHLFFSEEEQSLAFVSPGYEGIPGLTMLPLAHLEKSALDPDFRNKLAPKILGSQIPLPEQTPVANRLDPEVVKSWFLDRDFSEKLFQNLSAGDYRPGVLWILQTIRKASPSEFAKYQDLAIAVAVVMDARRPNYWPHHQVKRDLVPAADPEAAEWFLRWVRADHSGELFTDLKTLPANLAKFVVDAPLQESEYKWAVKSAKFPRSGFEKAFSSIPYDQSRIASEKLVWDQGDYTLKSIADRGGICVDQAYFAMVAGKARGLPTLFFTGQGADGGHAWFGYLKTNGKWEMDAGRYENQNYAVGEALDPQSWQKVDDHQLRMISSGDRDKPPSLAARDDLVLAKLFEERGNNALAARAYESAWRVSPTDPEVWIARDDFLVRSGAPLSDLKNFHEAGVRQFESDRSLRSFHQERLAEIARESGDAAAAEALEKQIVSRNRFQRSDLSVAAGARKLTALVGENRMEEALSEYRRLVNNLAKTGGGNFFYEIVVPFSNQVATSGDREGALRVVEQAEKALSPSPGSILDMEFEKLKSSFL